jgi:hypothetical protein
LAVFETAVDPEVLWRTATLSSSILRRGAEGFDTIPSPSTIASHSVA